MLDPAASAAVSVGGGVVAGAAGGDVDVPAVVAGVLAAGL